MAVEAGCVVVVVGLSAWPGLLTGKTETAPTPALGVVGLLDLSGLLLLLGVVEVELVAVLDVLLLVAGVVEAVLFVVAVEADAPESDFLTSGTTTPIIILLPINLPFRSATTTLAFSGDSYLCFFKNNIV